MNCPNCDVHWVFFRGGGSSTIDLGRCSNCGAEYVGDLVQLVKETDMKKKERRALPREPKDVYYRRLRAEQKHRKEVEK